MPTMTAMTLIRVILSFGRKNQASIRPKTVIIACRTAASPDVMCCSAQNTML